MHSEEFIGVEDALFRPYCSLDNLVHLRKTVNNSSCHLFVQNLQAKNVYERQSLEGLAFHDSHYFCNTFTAGSLALRCVHVCMCTTGKCEIRVTPCATE